MLYCNLINLLDQRKLLAKVKINLIQKKQEKNQLVNLHGT